MSVVTTTSSISETCFGFHHQDTTGHFRLSDGFLKRYEGKKPNFGFNGLGEFVFFRTYSRSKPDGSKETFLDTIKRVVEGCYEIQRRHCLKINVPWTESKAQASAQEMFKLMWEFKFLPPGRGLWMMGTEFMWQRGSAALNNCGFVSTTDIDNDPSEPFCFLMDMSMLGVGVGFDTKGAGKLIIQDPGDLPGDVYKIDDSREGWVDSYRKLIHSYTTEAGRGRVIFDYSGIRPANSLIKGFGGKASGPGILMELHELTRNLLDSFVGKALTSIGIVDLMNLVGRCVVAGNVRRCLPKGTLVHLKRGLVPIEQVQVGDMVLTSDGYHQVAENVHQGVQNVLTVNTQMGPMRCTARHRIAVMTGIGKYEWRRAFQLRKGDRIVFVAEQIPGVVTSLPGCYDSSKRGKRLVVPALDTKAAWLIGMVHGDGYVYPGRTYKGRKHHGAYVGFPINRDEYHDGILDKLKDGLAEFGMGEPTDHPSGDNSHKVRTISRKFAHYFHKHFKQAKTPLGVPECVRLASPEIRSAYLAGLLDSDGSTKNRPTTLVSSVYRDFLRQVQAVYSSLGIPTKLKLRKEADGPNQEKWEISLVGDFAIDKFKELVQPHAVKVLRETSHASGHDFGFPAEWVKAADVDYGRSWTPQSSQMTYNRATLCEAAVGKLVPVEVESVVDEDVECDTYDLSVPERSEFVAEGRLVHNTAEIAFGEADDEAYFSMKDATATLITDDIPAWNATLGVIGSEGRSDLSESDFVCDDGSYAIPLDRLKPAIDTWNACIQHRWASNNSIMARVGMDYTKVSKRIAANGEPGLIWLDNIRNYGRMVDGYQPGIDGRADGTNPCSEQSLERYELCCLVETFPANHESAEEYMRTLKFAYLYAKSVTLLPTHNARTNAVMLRNRRIGLSQSGIVQAFEKFGRRNVLTDFCDQGYITIRNWDRTYSEWLCVPKSIKVTSVKPSGTVSLVVGATPGIHYPEARTYWRRVRVSSTSSLAKIFAEAGYHVEPAVSDPDRTVVIKFGVSDERVRPTSEVSIWEQTQNAIDYQKWWADNQVSCTVKFTQDEAKYIKNVLEAYDDSCKGISFLPYVGHGYAQAPYEPCAEEEVREYNSGLGEVDLSRYIMEDAIGTTGCDGDSCTI